MSTENLALWRASKTPQPSLPPSSKFPNRRIWNSRHRTRINNFPSSRARVTNARSRVSNECTNSFARIDTSTVVKKGLSSIVGRGETFRRVEGGCVPAFLIRVYRCRFNFHRKFLRLLAGSNRQRAAAPRVNRCRYIKNNDARIGSQSPTHPLPLPTVRENRSVWVVERRVPPACVTTFSTIVSYPETIFE